MKLPFFSTLLLLSQITSVRAMTVDEISKLIGEGHWRQARQEIAQELSRPDTDFRTREALLFQSDRMRRMSLDFDKSREKVFQEARAIVPSITEAQFSDWEKAGSLEFLDIDGTRRYFDRAAANLFRINPEARALKARLHPNAASNLSYRLEDIQSVLASYDKTGEQFNMPRTWRVTYELNVKPGMVPPGEVIRAWLPFPHAGNRQKDIRMIHTDPPNYILPATNGAIASVYMEQPAAEEGPTRFKVSFEYTSAAFYQKIDPARVRQTAADDPAASKFLGEQPPQIVFSDDVQKISSEIVGNETNPYLKARSIFQWVSEHIPWASAREYSTIECLPHYSLSNRHGDCGIKALTFMTLCRFNSIPARWESGWITGPEKNMHDWCEIYLTPYGWIPVDVSYGLVNSEQDREKWFYLGGIDGARFVVNTDYAQPLYPAKTFFRSEVVDFQRGEAEWRGGNLYFDQWDWDFDVKEITAGNASKSNISE